MENLEKVKTNSPNPMKAIEHRKTKNEHRRNKLETVEILEKQWQIRNTTGDSKNLHHQKTTTCLFIRTKTHVLFTKAAISTCFQRKGISIKGQSSKWAGKVNKGFGQFQV